MRKYRITISLAIIAMLISSVVSAETKTTETTVHKKSSFKLGFSTGLGMGVPLSGYINEAPVSVTASNYLTQVKMKLSYSVSATLLLNDFEIGYTLNAFRYGNVELNNGKQLDPSSQAHFHKFHLGYRIYFHKSWIRPYLPLSLGFVLATSPGANVERKYGLDVSAGLGIEFRLHKNIYIGLDARYHYNLTNKPLGVIESDVTYRAIQQGLSYTNINSLNDLPYSISDAIGQFHYIDIRLGLTFVI